jgi:hypothetical protein
MSYLSPSPVDARPPAVHDFYGPIHKGLRFALCGLLTRLGAVDPADGPAVAAVLADLRLQLSISAEHLDHEARAPGASRALAQDHAHHRASFVALRAAMAAVEATEPRGPALHRLYLAFSRFVAEDLAHMAEEEEVTLPVMQALFTDEELLAIEGRIQAGIPPEALLTYARIMAPAAHPGERLAMLAGVREGMIREGAPPEAFAVLLAHGVRPVLADADWDALAAGLGVAA